MAFGGTPSPPWSIRPKFWVSSGDQTPAGAPVEGGALREQVGRTLPAGGGEIRAREPSPLSSPGPWTTAVILAPLSLLGPLLTHSAVSLPRNRPGLASSLPQPSLLPPSVSGFPQHTTHQCLCPAARPPSSRPLCLPHLPCPQAARTHLLDACPLYQAASGTPWASRHPLSRCVRHDVPRASHMLGAAEKGTNCARTGPSGERCGERSVLSRRAGFFLSAEDRRGGPSLPKEPGSVTDRSF